MAAAMGAAVAAADAAAAAAEEAALAGGAGGNESAAMGAAAAGAAARAAEAAEAGAQVKLHSRPLTDQTLQAMLALRAQLKDPFQRSFPITPCPVGGGYSIDLTLDEPLERGRCPDREKGEVEEGDVFSNMSQQEIQLDLTEDQGQNQKSDRKCSRNANAISLQYGGNKVPFCNLLKPGCTVPQA